MTDDTPRDTSQLFRPVRAKRTSDEAVQQIVELVRGGDLQPGERLPSERELVRRLGVSRSSLREAIYVLQTMGVLRVVRGHGSYVREDVSPTLSHDWYDWALEYRRGIVELLELFEVLEVKLAALAAERATAAEIAELRTHLDEIACAVADSDYERLVAADAAFHVVIRTASENGVIARLLTDLDENVFDVRRGIMALPQKPLRVVDEHRRLYEAIEAHDPVAAAEAMLEQVSRSKEEVLAFGLPALRDKDARRPEA